MSAGPETRTQVPTLQELAGFDYFQKHYADRSEEFMLLARQECPVAHTDASGGYFIVSRYADVRRVLEDPATFSSRAINIAGNGGVIIPPIDADPPIQRDFRRLLNPFLLPARMLERESTIRDIAVQTMEPWLTNGTCDFSRDYASPFVVDVLSKVVFEERDRDLFRRAAAYNERVSLGDVEAYPQFHQIISDFVEGRRQKPPPDFDIVRAINEGQVAGRPLTDAERIGTVMILFAGGLDTTTVALSNIIAELATHPELEEVLRAPGWDDAVLNEFLRLDSPVRALGRECTRDTEINGQPISAGDRVLVHYASANRDARAFDTPDELCFNRKGNPHLAFGMGVHRCIGRHLASVQIRVAIDSFLTVATRIRLSPGVKLERRPGMSPVIEHLPIEFDLR